MENSQPRYPLSFEVQRLDAAISGKINLFMEENEITGSSCEAIGSFIEDHKDLKKRHFDALVSAIHFPLESPVEQVQDFLTKNNQLAIIQLSDLSERIDRCRETSAKYSVPTLQDFKSLEPCVDATGSFMRAWIDEAEQRRAVGERSLVEWIRELDHRKHATTLESMRLSIIDIGNMISIHLCSYFMLINSISREREALAAKIRSVEALLECLMVEENKSGTSLVIDRFKSVVRFVKTVLNVGDYGNDDIDVTVLRLKWNESHLVASILREVLRFEVGLSCPDLPMMLTDDIFLGMAMYMRHVFEMKLGALSFELRVLKENLKISHEDPDIKNLLDFGTKKIWDEIGLNVRS